MKISQKSLHKMRIRGAIKSVPPTPEDQAFLDRLEKIWGDADLLRHQLSVFSMKRRKRIIDTADYYWNWERWAHIRFAEDKGAYGSSTAKLEDVFLQLKEIFKKIDKHICPDEWIKHRLTSIRRRARRGRAKS